MKVAYTSDLHLEHFQPTDYDLLYRQFESLDADVLILAGDILNGDDLKTYPLSPSTKDLEMSKKAVRVAGYGDFLKYVASKVGNVLIVKGNHEMYGGKFHETDQIIADRMHAGISNVRYLEKEVVEIQGVTFAGATLWTDFNNKNPITLHAVPDLMNDYKHITDRHKNTRGDMVYHKLSVHTVLQDHMSAVRFIKSVSPDVLITHHAPTAKSVHPRFSSDFHMNGAFCSNLADLLMDSPNLKFHVHGHVHDVFDYMVGDCRVLCNPRGYVQYDPVGSFELRYFEVE